MAYIQRHLREEYQVDPKMFLVETAEDKEQNELILFGDDDTGNIADDFARAKSLPLTLRAEPLLIGCLEAVAEAYEISRGEAVRRLLFLGLGHLAGEIVEDQPQLELGGVGGRAPDAYPVASDLLHARSSNAANAGDRPTNPPAKPKSKEAA